MGSMIEIDSSIRYPDCYRDPPPAWKQAEDIIRDEHDLVKDHSRWHDARTTDGTPVEIKSCACRYADGRLGRFKIWEYQLDELLFDGKVGFLVYYNTGRKLVIVTHMMPAESLIGKGTKSFLDHPTRGLRRLRRIKWTDIIPLDGIQFGSRRAFTDHYPEDEVEDTMLMQ
jgi:hypothetical protein